LCIDYIYNILYSYIPYYIYIYQHKYIRKEYGPIYYIIYNILHIYRLTSNIIRKENGRIFDIFVDVEDIHSINIISKLNDDCNMINNSMIGKLNNVIIYII
jgi:hypothetical protein